MNVNDEELLMIKKQDDSERANLIIDLPFNWLQYCNKKVNIGFLVWEGDKIPLSWVEIIEDERINQVWVPSSHTYNAIKNTFNTGYWDLIKHKIKIVPHGVDLSLFKPEEKPNRIFTFLVNKGFRNEFDRGGMQHAIRAFVREFNKGEARLILKLNPSYAMHPNQLIQFINQVCIEENKNNQNTPEIIFNYTAFPTNQLKEVYNECDVLLNTTEGEAFSLPCIEAMACGKPVITTNFGGQTDFITNLNGWLINYDLHEVKHEVMYEGISWGKPKLNEIQIAMRESFSNREQTKEKGVLSLRTAQDWTWDNSALKALECLKSL